LIQGISSPWILPFCISASFLPGWRLTFLALTFLTFQTQINTLPSPRVAKRMCA
jgi:hypothetical protein